MAPPPVARAKIEAAGGIDWVCEQLEQGRSLRNIATELQVGTMTLHDYCHRDGVHSARSVAATAAGAEAYEEEAARILRVTYEMLDCDTPHPNGSALASLARERAQAAWRMAGTRDPSRFGDTKRATLNVSITHAPRTITTEQLERLVAQQAQTLELAADGTVGGTSE